MRTMFSILPLTIVTLLTIVFISYSYSRSLIEQEINQKMKNQMESISNELQIRITAHSTLTKGVARAIETAPTSLTPTQYTSLLKNSLSLSSDTFGTGVYFEPNKYRPNLKYFSYYAYRTGDNVTFTDKYSDPKYDYPNQDWYIRGKTSTQPITYSPPYLDNSTNVTMVTATAPFYDQNKNLLGVATGDIDITELQKIIRNTKVGNTGWAFLVDNTGTYITNPDEQKVMKTKLAQDPNKSLASLSKQMASEKNGHSVFEDANGKNQIFFTRIPQTDWVLALVMPEHELFSPLQSLMKILTTVSAIAILIIIGVILLYSRYITSNITRINNISKVMSTGDFTQTIETDSVDEFGQMADNFNDMTMKVRDMMLQVANNSHHVAATSEQLTASAEQTSKATEQISEAIQQVATGSDTQSGIVTTTHAIVTRVSDGIHQITNRVHEVSEASQHAAQTSASGIQVVETARGHMNLINEKVQRSDDIIHTLGQKSEEIGKIVSLITSIAGQTNLLALNAAIEAARAGEHGRGFAVVADEVRKLAEQSAHAADDISYLITHIQSETDKAVQAMQEGSSAVSEGMVMVDNASVAFKEIRIAVQDVSGQIGKVTEVVTHIQTGTQQMIQSMNQLTDISESAAENTQQVAAAVEEQTASMEEVASASIMLSKMAEELNEVITRFKI
ncbi:methyl-accepting chemotaxis protein [Aneurinibacillus soli]|nr:methyl-accepting chemotaxis protein [Aneurinibacillus soli]